MPQNKVQFHTGMALSGFIERYATEALYEQAMEPYRWPRGSICVGERRFSELEPFRSVNTFISNAKTAITGTYHPFHFHKCRHRHLAEAQYRSNHRFDLASLVWRLAQTYMRKAPCPERRVRPAQVAVS